MQPDWDERRVEASIASLRWKLRVDFPKIPRDQVPRDSISHGTNTHVSSMSVMVNIPYMEHMGYEYIIIYNMI
jgi:hypothetical protein